MVGRMSQAPMVWTEIQPVGNYRPPKPCPFCGSEALTQEGFHLTCLNCGACGPDADDDDGSSVVSAWDRRHENDQPRHPGA